MNYIIVLFMIGMSFLFAILSFISKNNTRDIFMLGSAIMFLATGILILGYGIELPIGTLTTIVR